MKHNWNCLTGLWWFFRSKCSEKPIKQRQRCCLVSNANHCYPGLSRNSRDPRSRLEKCQFETRIEKYFVEKSRIEKWFEKWICEIHFHLSKSFEISQMPYLISTIFKSEVNGYLFLVSLDWGMAEANIVTIPDYIIENRTNKRAKEDLPKSFHVQFVNGRQTEYRRCIACGTNIKCKDSNTTGLRRHIEVCNRDRGSKDDKQGELPFARGKAAKIEKGLGDMLLRYNEMKDELVFITDNRLSNYNWKNRRRFAPFQNRWRSVLWNYRNQTLARVWPLRLFDFLIMSHDTKLLWHSQFDQFSQNGLTKRNCQWDMSQIWWIFWTHTRIETERKF